MAKSSFADPDFSLLKGSETRKQEARIKAQVADYRRHQVKTSDPNASKQLPWLVTGKDLPAPPLWSIERDTTGKPVAIKQLRRNPNGIDVDPRFTARRYRLEIIATTSVAGEHCEPGVMVDGFADVAMTLHGAGLGKIQEEYPEA